MWAYLLLSPRMSLKQKIMIPGLCALGLVGSASAAKAADITSMYPMTPGSSAKVMDAETGPKGQLATGLTVTGSEVVMDKNSFNHSLTEENGTVLQDAHRFSTYLGASLTKNFEFTLGLHGTYEHVRPELRDDLLVDSESDRELYASGWRQDVKQAGFAGASMFFKVNLIDEKMFKLSFAPFVESGVGEQATYSLTRSVSPKMGWMVLGDVGMKGYGVFSLNAGYRYRDPESVGNLVLRNELFYQASAKTWLGYGTSLFVAGQGRKIMLNRNDERDEENKLVYSPRETGEWSTGVGVKVSDIDINLSYGRKFSSAKGFGIGASNFGVSMSMPIGNFAGRRVKPRYAEAVEREMNREESMEAKRKEDDKAKLANGTETPKKTVSIEEQYPEMIGADIDPLKMLDKDEDDFSRTEKEMQADAGKPATLSEDEKIAQELAELRAAEEKAEQAQKEREAAEAEVRRQQAVKDAASHAKEVEEWMNEANGDLESYEGISDQEMNWNGLDD